MSKQLYAAGSIVEQIESHQSLRNVGVGPARKITVKATNQFGMQIVTEHYSLHSAQWQRDWHKNMGHTGVE